MDRRTVLVVDQNESLLASLVEIITAAGHSVVPCRCFEEGRHYLQRETPHVIVTGLRLGAFNGLHLVLLARQKAPGLPAIVYSGREDSGIERDAASGGASYLDQGTLTATLLPQLHAALGLEPSTSATEMPATPCLTVGVPCDLTPAGAPSIRPPLGRQLIES